MSETEPVVCKCPTCNFHTRCGWEMTKEHERNLSPTCDDDCTHGRWYIDNYGILRCDRICNHVIDNFVCPFTKHDDQVIVEALKKLKMDLQSRFISSTNQWSKGRNSGLLECCNIIDVLLGKGGKP